MPCYERLPVPARQWSDLYEVLGTRDFVKVSSMTEAMLPQGAIEASSRNDYLLMAAMPGQIARGHRPVAATLWHRYRPSGEPSLVLRLLRAHAGTDPPHCGNAGMAPARR